MQAMHFSNVCTANSQHKLSLTMHRKARVILPKDFDISLELTLKKDQKTSLILHFQSDIFLANLIINFFSNSRKSFAKKCMSNKSNVHFPRY